MKINKVLILGIDALEYKLVEQWDLKNLKQEEYGKIELPLCNGQEPATVIIWPCFITGKVPREMGYSTVRVFPDPIQKFVEIFYPSLRKFFIDYDAKDIKEKKIGKQLLLNKIGEFLWDIGLLHSPSRKNIKSDTIFDIPNVRSIHSHIPVYDKDAFPPYRKNTLRAIEDPLNAHILELACYNEFRQRTREVFDQLNSKKWDLFMQYFFLLDAIQHVFYKNMKKIAKFYLMFDEFVGKVRRKIDNNTILLIISDHGQKKGIHTRYGFYSINKPLGLKNPKIIDFRKIIEAFLK